MTGHDPRVSGRSGGPGLPARSKRWAAGIVNHGGYDDLARCLAALDRQSHPPASISVYDTGADPDRFERQRGAFPRANFEMGPNLGYAGGANRVIARLTDTGDTPDFVLVLNPDVILDPEYAARLVDVMTHRASVAIGTGKLLRPDRKTLDSAGIVIPRHRRPRDRGSDQTDIGQFETPEFVDAASGAAIMLRVSALADLAIEGEIFDEDFFVYHEDTDLCWRARRLGWQILYEPSAVGYHERGWQRKRRSTIPVATRRHSFKNHYLQLAKNERAGDFIRNLPWLAGWEILRLGFVVLRDRAMFRAYRDAWLTLPEAFRKRGLIQTRARRRGPEPESEER